MHNIDTLKSLLFLWSGTEIHKIFVYWPNDQADKIINDIVSTPDGLFFIIGFDRLPDEHYCYVDTWLFDHEHTKKNVFLLNEDFISQTLITQQLKCIQPLNFCHDLIANLSFLQEHRYKINKDFNDTQLNSNNQWLCLNRTMRDHRQYVCFSWLPKYKDNIIYSQGQMSFIGDINFYNNFQGYPPWVSNASNLFSLKQHYHKTCGSIVVETAVKETPPLSEKIFHAFLAMHPVMIVGVAGIVDYLRTHDFDMFDDILDHSYDLIPDTTERIDRLFLNNHQIIRNGIDRRTIKDRLKKNQDNVWKYYDGQLCNLEISFNKIHQHYDNSSL
jgi:hypothetical protein